MMNMSSRGLLRPRRTFSRAPSGAAGRRDLSGPDALCRRSHDPGFGLSGSGSGWQGGQAFATGLPPIGGLFDGDGRHAEPGGRARR